MRIDFQTFEVEPVPLRLEDGWRLVTLDSGERHTNAGSAYNERRAECSEACELLGVDSLRQASWDALEGLPERLRRRARHVLSENVRVEGHGGRVAGRRPACRGTSAERFPCKLARPIRSIHACRRGDRGTAAPHGRRRREDRGGRLWRARPWPACTRRPRTGGRSRGAGEPRCSSAEIAFHVLTFSAQDGNTTPSRIGHAQVPHAGGTGRPVSLNIRT